MDEELLDRFKSNISGILSSSHLFQNYYHFDNERLKSTFDRFKSIFDIVDFNSAISIISNASLFLDDKELNGLEMALFKYTPKDRLNKFNKYFWDFLFSVIARIKAHYDYIGVITGYPGSGKSTFAKTIVYFHKLIMFQKKPEPENLIFDFTDLAKSLVTYRYSNYEAFHVDEAGTLLFSREAGKKNNRLVVKLLQIIRERQWLFLMLIPDLNWLDVYVRKSRMSGWLHLENRGSVEFLSVSELRKRAEFNKASLNPAYLRKILKNKYVLTYPDFDWDSDVFQLYNQKKSEHIDNLIDEFAGASLGDEVEKANTPESFTSSNTSVPLFLGKFPILTQSDSWLMPAGELMYLAESNKHLPNIFDRNDEVIKTLTSRTSFRKKEKSEIVKEYFKVSPAQWDAYLELIDASKKDKFEFGFDIFRTHLLGMCIREVMNNSKIMLSPLLFRDIYARCGERLNLNSTIDAFIFMNSPLTSQQLLDIHKLLTERYNEVKEGLDNENTGWNDSLESKQTGMFHEAYVKYILPSVTNERLKQYMNVIAVNIFERVLLVDERNLETHVNSWFGYNKQTRCDLSSISDWVKENIDYVKSMIDGLYYYVKKFLEKEKPNEPGYPRHFFDELFEGMLKPSLFGRNSSDVKQEDEFKKNIWLKLVAHYSEYRHYFEKRGKEVEASQNIISKSAEDLYHDFEMYADAFVKRITELALRVVKQKTAEEIKEVEEKKIEIKGVDIDSILKDLDRLKPEDLERIGGVSEE